jgi:hypothetical protein
MPHIFLSFYEYKTCSFRENNFLVLSVIIEQISASYDNNKTKTQVMRGNERKKKHCGQQRFLLLSPPSTKRECFFFLEKKKGEKFRLKNYTKKTRQGKCKKVVPYPQVHLNKKTH